MQELKLMRSSRRNTFRSALGKKGGFAASAHADDRQCISSDFRQAHVATGAAYHRQGARLGQFQVEQVG